MLPLFCLTLCACNGNRVIDSSISTSNESSTNVSNKLRNVYTIGYSDHSKQEYLSWGINTENGNLEIWNVYSIQNRYVVLSIPFGKYQVINIKTQGYLYEYDDFYILTNNQL